MKMASGNRLSLLAGSMLLAAVAVVGSGCDNPSAPRLEHSTATLTDRTPEGVSMAFTLDAYNDNEIPLPLRDFEYTVSIDGRDVFRGTRSAEATLRRKGVQQLRLPAVIALEPGQEAPSGMQEFRVRGTLTYVTPGKIAELLFDSGVRVPTANFKTEGQIDLGAAN